MIDAKRLTSTSFDLIKMRQLLDRLPSKNGNRTAVEEVELRLALNNHLSFTFIAFDRESDPDRYLGMATLLIHRIPSKWTADIYDIVIDAGQRNNEVGELLIQNLIEAARIFSKSKRVKLGIYLKSHPSQAKANLLYEKMGFVLVVKADGESGTNFYKTIIELQDS